MHVYNIYATLNRVQAPFKMYVVKMSISAMRPIKDAIDSAKDRGHPRLCALQRLATHIRVHLNFILFPTRT